MGHGEVEIDIHTHEDHRIKGYATIVATAFIHHCLQHNLTPVWSRWPFRKESIQLATKLGFREEKKLPAIYWAENM